MAKDTPKEPVDKVTPDIKNPLDNKSMPDSHPKQPDAPLPDISPKDTTKPAEPAKAADTVVPLDKIGDILTEKKVEVAKPG